MSVAALDAAVPTGATVLLDTSAVLAYPLISLAPGVTDRISVSIGIACAPLQAQDRITLLRLADEALYRAKQDGRNRVEFAGLPEAPRSLEPAPSAAAKSRRAKPA
jgi:diguanylate cyclase (GGDEF)-like protein